MCDYSIIEGCIRQSSDLPILKNKIENDDSVEDLASEVVACVERDYCESE